MLIESRGGVKLAPTTKRAIYLQDIYIYVYSTREAHHSINCLNRSTLPNRQAMPMLSLAGVDLGCW